MLDRPIFIVLSDPPNPNPQHITAAEWWMRNRLLELEPKSQDAGIYGNFKSGFHNSGKGNTQDYPGNYSVRDQVNRTGEWWWEYGAAQDWTFPDAQRGDFTTINKYTSRLMKSALDQHDPRLDLVLFEFFGNSDTDRQVEGYDEYHEEAESSDSSHLWHIHMSYVRSLCGSFWGMWALLTVLMGWTVDQWKLSLSGDNDMFLAKDNTDPVYLSNGWEWTHVQPLEFPYLQKVMPMVVCPNKAALMATIGTERKSPSGGTPAPTFEHEHVGGTSGPVKVN